ncbi:carboxypeptidase regulatory-like domain-containing protein [Janthinobacterium fluminis]|uniref:Carboxypeptidase regulatory-like domain-containing protein n=1 Tax=Janthinobacterium fluminis TaxID=2987524 RepID=A0ABT5JXQ8_9BURK|nr:carboxypeptidase regulatory-like domain-containing protein [Janthinobacterium fluminis]MDC8756327.1 carboxypeptidase regulatory-like domain-containing protein [Janthinobacterium fluminis]
MKAKFALLMACGVACGAALAQSGAAGRDVAAHLAPTTENGVTYLCGGIGSTEAAQMKRDASAYNLMLTFAENTGAYLANVGVNISDARGNTILETTCDAPIMLVNFPKAGTYRVKAEVDGHPLNRVVRVSGRGRHSAVSMVWPSRLIEPAPAGNLQGALAP